MFAVFAFSFLHLLGLGFQEETVSEIITAATGAMTSTISATVIATIAIAAITLTLAWSGLRRVLRVGGR